MSDKETKDPVSVTTTTTNNAGGMIVTLSRRVAAHEETIREKNRLLMRSLESVNTLIEMNATGAEKLQAMRERAKEAEAELVRSSDEALAQLQEIYKAYADEGLEPGGDVKAWIEEKLKDFDNEEQSRAFHERRAERLVEENNDLKADVTRLKQEASMTTAGAYGKAIKKINITNATNLHRISKALDRCNAAVRNAMETIGKVKRPTKSMKKFLKDNIDTCSEADGVMMVLEELHEIERTEREAAKTVRTGC